MSPCWNCSEDFNGISVGPHLVLFFYLDNSFSKTVRLENEHLGNVDQYRVTREVPLPYPPDTMVRDDDEVERDLRAKVQSYRT